MNDAAATRAILRLLTKIPLYRLPDEDASGTAPGAKSQAELHETYRRLDIGLTTLTVILVVPLVFGWLHLFQLLGGQVHPEIGPSGRVLGPSVYYWALPALFAGIVLAGVPPLLIARLALRERYTEYVSYYNRKSGFDAFRLFRHLAVVVAPVVVFGVYLGATTYTIFLEDRMVIKGPLADARSHNYSEIQEITALPTLRSANGKRVKRQARYEILFEDGTRWKTSQGLRDSDPPCDYPVMAFAARMAGTRISGPDILAGEPASTDCR